MGIYLTQFFTIMVIHFFAVASPGPDFAVVVKNSFAYGKKKGIITSLGVGTGIFIHVTYCLLGIGLIISKSIIVFNTMKLIAAAYLIYIGIRALKSKPMDKDYDIENNNMEISVKKAFLSGFITNGLNPKATLFFLALFTVIIKSDTPIVIQGLYGIYMAFATAVWFTLVSVFFGDNRVRRMFKKWGHWVDRAMGGILIVLGIKIATSKM